MSRLSIPPDPGGEDVCLDLQAALEAANQIRRIGRDRQEPRDRPAVLGDDDAFGIDAVEERQTLFLEFRRGDGLHQDILNVVTISVHSAGD